MECSANLDISRRHNPPPLAPSPIPRPSPPTPVNHQSKWTRKIIIPGSHSSNAGDTNQQCSSRNQAWSFSYMNVQGIQSVQHRREAGSNMIIHHRLLINLLHASVLLKSNQLNQAFVKTFINYRVLIRSSASVVSEYINLTNYFDEERCGGQGRYL